MGGINVDRKLAGRTYFFDISIYLVFRPGHKRGRIRQHQVVTSYLLCMFNQVDVLIHGRGANGVGHHNLALGLIGNDLHKLLLFFMGFCGGLD